MTVGSCAPVESDGCFADGDVLEATGAGCGLVRYGDRDGDGDPLRVPTKI